MLFGINPMKAQYCIPSGSAGNGAFIGEVCFPLTSNPFNNCNQTNSGGNYGDYTGLGSRATFSPTPVAPNTNQVILRVDRSNAGDYVYAGYIDCNQDQDFDDPGENVFTGSGNIPFPTGGGASATRTITVPASASNGLTRMRIIAKSGTAPVTGPCETGFNGEPEDYAITITGGGVTCPTVTFTATPTNEICPGANNGSITISGEAGGVSPYEYSINNGTSYQTSSSCTGLTPNTYQVKIKDANDCESSTQSVTINAGVDNTLPVANCAAPFTVQLDANGMASITAADINNGSTDNCGIASTTIDITNFDCSNLGANTVTLTVNDVNGNTATCTTVVTVEDNLAPVANCAAPFTIQLDANGMASITVGDIENGSNDNCGVASTTIDISDFDCSNVGPNTVTLTATDSNGNSSTCTTIVTVEDNIPPTVTCPGDIIADNDSGTCGAVVNYTITAEDNCGGTTGSQTFSYTGTIDSFVIPAGVTNITIEARGAQGGYTTASAILAGKGAVMKGDFSVTPGSSLKILVGENNNSGNGGGGGTFVTDAANSPLIVAGGGGGAAADLDSPNKHGQTGTTGGAGAGAGGTGGTAGNGGNVGASFASGAGGGLLTNGADGWTPGTGGFAFVNGGAGANVGFGIGGFGGGGNGSGNVVGGGGGGYSGGGSGSNATGGGVGGGGASFNAGSNQVNTTGDIDGNAGNGLVTISWDSSITPVQTAGLPSGSTFPVGTTTNTFVLTDASGNTATCSFDVTVNDTEAPEITCPGNITQDNDAGACGAVITYATPVGTDNCSGVTTVQTAGLASGSTFPVGTTTNIFLVTDGSGNTASCSFDVTINDIEPPVANCAAPFTIQLDTNGMANITAADIETGSTDNCGIASTTVDIMDFDCSNVGPNSVTLTVTDVNGNVSTCSTIVTVEDNVAPVANCAAPFAVQLDANGMASITVADIDNGSADACGIASTTIDVTDFDCSNVGPNTVTLTVTDVNGNVSTCTTIVTVEDNILPAITCPADITVNTTVGFCSAIVNFPMAFASDNCGVASVTQTMGDPTGSMFPVGNTTIEFTAMDVNGNSNTCSFVITVVDNEAPIAVCQNITVQLDEFGNASIAAADVDGGSTDQCGVAGIAIDIDTFDCSDVGDNNVVLTVADVNGNVSTCTAIVTVEDVTAPVVACQDITVELDPITGTVTITGTDIDNGSTDACGIDTYTLDSNTFDCSNIGENTVVLAVTDVNGNTATCTATVTVEDNTSPVLVCQDFTIEIGADGTATLDPSDVIASNDDACGILTVAVDITEFSCADIGTPVMVQVFSQDSNGNLATCTATVTAVDLLAPVIMCPTDQTVDPGAGNLFYILPDYFATGEATAIDNCTDPVTITSQDPAVGTALPDGTYTITMTATDEYGNVGTCEFELTVDTTLGISENSQNLGSISMYPNPAKEKVVIGNPQNLDLEKADIYDLTGRLVQSFSLKGMAATKTLNIDTLASAAYIVIIKAKEGQITKRLLKE